MEEARSKSVDVPDIGNKPQQFEEQADKNEVNEIITVSDSDRTDRIEKLKSSINDAKRAFENAGQELEEQIKIWITFCVILIIAAIIFLCKIYQDDSPDLWIHLVFESTIRILISASFFALASFLFKMLSGHIQMYQTNRHKQSVIASFASFVESADAEQRKIIFIKLVETVISNNELKVPTKEPDVKVDYSELIKILAEASKRM